MLSKLDIMVQSQKLGFEDIGFTTAEPFTSQKKVLLSRQKEYAWLLETGFDLMQGTDPKQMYPEAKSIIVLMAVYFHSAYPRYMERHFGRCYMDDDRITRDGLSKQVMEFCGYLSQNGINFQVPFNLTHRLSATRAGMGTFGRNCLFYSNKLALQSSWVSPIAIMVDREFEPGEPTFEVGCPDWCKNACLVACPTGALKGPRFLDPLKCISYLTYSDTGITAKEFREPMGVRIYGCDHCQNVCPRNAPWLAKKLPVNEKVAAKEKDFDLPLLLHMDKEYFESRIWPHMFYTSFKDIWRWKMNVARAMGNSLDPDFLPDLIRAFGENEDERVQGMIAWALGRIGGPKAKSALEGFLHQSEGLVRDEVVDAIENHSFFQNHQRMDPDR